MTKKTLCFLFSFGALSFLTTSSVFSHPSSPPYLSHDFHNWSNRPKAPFPQGKAMFARTYQLLLKHYYGPKLTEDALYKAAIQGMLRFIDPSSRKWNKLMSPHESKELRNALKSEIAGIGVQIKFHKSSGMTEVLGIIPKSPAQTAKLKVGDQILMVNGKLYKGKQFRDIVYAIRGKIGTPVTLQILRGAKLITIKVKRGRVRWQNIHSWKLPGRVGMVKISMFAKETPKHLTQHLQKLRAHATKGFIVDLRGNTGGALKSALDCGKLLLGKDKLITTLRKRDRKVTQYRSTTASILANLPVYVLMDGKTSSGAELLAAALRDSYGATLVGTRTLGKWNVQSLINLPNGYVLKFTVGKFFSPRNKNYHQKGLQPDITLPKSKPISTHAWLKKGIKAHLRTDATLRIAHTLLLHSR